MIILIADSGSTKTDWCLIQNNQKLFFKTQGIHPAFLSEQQIELIIKTELLSQLNPANTIDEIYFYGAGCTPGYNSNKINQVLKNIFSNAATIQVQSDLLAAAHATVGNSEGLILILGTGSNSGVFNGEIFIEQISSMGYLLGDEGSGAWLGKILIRDFFRQQTPSEITVALSKIIKHQTVSDFLKELYAAPHPGKFLASFAAVILQHKKHPYVLKIVANGFTQLFEQVLLHYTRHTTQPINAVGSIAFYFEDVLKQIANKNGWQINQTIQTPIDGLADYYCTKKFN
jgi:N-acetylglucosamine kinase-like BadF-type ATPase